MYYWAFQLIFELSAYDNDLDIDNPDGTDYWILTPENIQIILTYENKIFASQEWNDRYLLYFYLRSRVYRCFSALPMYTALYNMLRFCWAGADPMSSNYSCAGAILSPARSIAEHYNYDFSSFSSQDAQNYTLSSNRKDFSSCFNPGFEQTGQAWIYRSWFYAGGPIGNGEFETVNGTKVPLTDYANAEDDFEGQTAEYYEWALPIYDDIVIDSDGELTENGMRIISYSWAVHDSYANKLMSGTYPFMGAAVLLVWMYMAFHLRSIFLASGAIFGILMSFPLAWFLYCIILQISLFGVY